MRYVRCKSARERNTDMKILKYSPEKRTEILSRTIPTVSVTESVRTIIDDVRARGDEALFELTERFDKAKLASLAVTKEEIETAYAETDTELLRVMKTAAANIEEFHRHQARQSFMMTRDGVVAGQRVLPLDSVGIYVPGGTAAYPSTVLMNAVPAKIAGCGRVVMVTPPSRDGKIAPAILAAAAIAGVDEIYKIGGAQAVAALAYGTESVPRVDKIVGPGNAYVAEAKRLVYGQVAIDMIAGPSEILVIADCTADPVFVAADLLSQAEHDVNASAVLVTDSDALAEAVSREIDRQLPLLEREVTASRSIEANGKIIVTDSIQTAIELSNELAPEHLELAVENPFDYLDSVRHAGSVFLGKYCPEAAGDYYAGANHTLPTGGTARFSSPLSVDDFVKKMQYTYYTKDAFGAVADDIAAFAAAEGLTAHQNSALVRVNRGN